MTIKLKCEFQWDSPRYFNFMQSIFFKSDLYGNRKFQMEIETDAMEIRSSLKLLEICSQCIYVEKENGILVSQKYYCQSFLPNGVNPEHLTSTLSANGMLKDFSPNHTYDGLQMNDSATANNNKECFLFCLLYRVTLFLKYSMYNI